MTTDTLKSLAMLKKSLKMNRRATEKNQKADGTTDTEVKSWQSKIDFFINDIETLEKQAALVTPATTAGIVQPDPAASTISTVPIMSGTDDDLLTVP